MIRELRFFIRLCRDKSIRKASSALFITPQGLSKAMKSLEAELGVQLFTRSNEGIVPTAAGKFVAKKARAIVDGYADMKQGLGEFTARTGSQVRITIASGVIHALQPDFFYEYQHAYPENEMIVGEYPDLAGEQALLDGEAEIGLAIGPIDSRQFASTRLRSENVTVIVNKDNPISKKRSLSFKDLANEKWVLTNQKYKTYHTILAKCAELGVMPKITMLAADIDILFKFCHRNIGIGFAIDRALADSGYDSLRSIPLAADSACHWDIHLIARKRVGITPAARGFAEFVRNWFKDG